MGWLKYVALLPVLYTLVKETVALVEDVAADGKIDGPEKKAAALAAVRKGMESLGYGAIWGVLEPVADALIEVTVAVYNALKWKRGPAVEGPSTDSVADGVVEPM
jgi:hypothetical protein